MYHDHAALRSPDGGACFGCHAARCRVCITVRPDVASGGFPCPPFSAARTKSGSTARTGPPEQHPLFDLVMRQYLDYIDYKRPRSFWLEEVKGFLVALKSLGGISPCQQLVNDLKIRNYYCEAIVLNHSTFVKNSRERVFLIGCEDGEDGAGGAAGARDVRDTVLEIVNMISKVLALKGGPPSILDIVDVDSLQERRRRRDTSATYTIYSMPSASCRRLLWSG